MTHTSRRRRGLFVPLIALLFALTGCRTARIHEETTSVVAAARPTGTRQGDPCVPRVVPGVPVVRHAVSAPVVRETAATGFGLRRAIEIAAQRNPRLAAARNRWRAATHRPAQARALPDPLLTYTEMVEPIETRAGPIDRDVQLVQKIPYPGKLSAAGAVATERARVSRLDYEIALRDVVAEVKVAYAELRYLHQAIRIVKQNQGIAGQLAEKSAALYAGADGEEPDPVTLFDTLKAQSQLAQLSYDLITLEELERTEEAHVNELLSRPPEASLPAPEGLAYRPLRAERQQLYQLALSRRQELEAALHKISAASQARRLAKLSRVPDFTLGVKYWMVGESGLGGPLSGEDAVGVTLGVTLPIWGEKNRARIAEAEYLKRAACLDRRAQIDTLMARINKVYFRIQNADRLVRLYKDSLIPQAKSAMEIAEQWRDTGRDTFGRLLEAQSVWLNFQLAYHRALADHEQTVARMEQLVGTSLAHLRRQERP